MNSFFIGMAVMAVVLGGVWFWLKLKKNKPAGEIRIFSTIEQLRAIHFLEQQSVGPEIQQDLRQVGVALHVFFAFAAGHFVERRLSDIDIAMLNQLRHLTIEEG